jgi:hypothetical protein
MKRMRLWALKGTTARPEGAHSQEKKKRFPDGVSLPFEARRIVHTHKRRTDFGGKDCSAQVDESFVQLMAPMLSAALREKSEPGYSIPSWAVPNQQGWTKGLQGGAEHGAV